MHAWRRFLNLIIRNDFAPVEFILAAQLAFGGFWILSPWYVPTNSVVMDTITSNILAWTFASWMLILGVAHIVSLLWLRWPYRFKVRKFCAWNITVLYLFLGVARGLTNGFSQIIWVSILALGMISAIAYINVSVADD